MSKFLFGQFCLFALVVSLAAATPEANKGNNAPASASASAPPAPLWLSAAALALPPPYPLLAPPNNALILEEPTYAQIGEIVEEIPTAISHQSSTVVHNHADVVTPIVAPAVRTHVLSAYDVPILYSDLIVAAKK